MNFCEFPSIFISLYKFGSPGYNLAAISHYKLNKILREIDAIQTVAIYGKKCNEKKKINETIAT